MILFSADWHIKIGQKNVPKQWATNRYECFFSLLGELEAHHDLHIVGGDLFDRLPSMEELALYWDWVASVKIPTIVFDGNHEATRKHHTFFDYLRSATARMNPLVEVVTSKSFTKEGGFGLLPYCDLHKKDWDKYFPDDIVLFTHVRGEIPPHVKPEIDLDRLEKFPVVFAGDLHSHSNCQRNIVYPGSPMTTSFHRDFVKTGVLSIDDSDWTWEWIELKLPQLIRKTVESQDEMIPDDYHHVIYELVGDVVALSDVKNTELLDKKVVKRKTDTALILTKDMEIADELTEYLLYIMELEEETVGEIVSMFHDYKRLV